ncbi:MAG: hypothetical protein RLZZ512_915 [Bacteroidota bacterium]
MARCITSTATSPYSVKDRLIQSPNALNEISVTLIVTGTPCNRHHNHSIQRILPHKRLSHHITVMRKPLIILLCLFLQFANADAQLYYNAPNASAYNPLNNKYLITNQGSGEVFYIDRAGNKTLFAKNLKSPRNIGFHKLPIGYSVLVLDSNRMVIYDTAGNQLGTETVSGIQQIQDCVYDSTAKSLYTTDRVRGCIYKTTFATASPYAPHTTIWVSNIVKPSAILLQKSKNRILLVQDTTNSNLIAISLLDSSVQTLRSLNIKNAMGLAEDAQGNLYIASVGDKYIYQLNKYYSGNPKVLLSEPKPGDITIVSERNEWVYTCIICGKVFVADIHLFGPDSEIVGCAGDSVTTYKNPFIKNIGTFEQGNEFTLELSNNQGDFSKGYELSRVTDTLIPAMISAVLPKNLSAGMGYRIRWSSTKPKITGYLQMTQILEAPTLLLSDKGSVRYDCDGLGIRLKAQDSAILTDYTWRVNGRVITDSTQFLTIKGQSQNTQFVHLEAKQSATGCTAHDSLKIIYAASPQVPQQLPIIRVCANDSVIFGDTFTNNTHQYNWKNGKGWNSQNMKPRYKALQTDTFQCTITSTQGCVSTTAQTLTVIQYDSIQWVTQSDTLLEVASKQKDTLYWFYNGKQIRADKQNQWSHPDTGWYHVCTGIKKRMGQVGCIQCVESFYVAPKLASTQQLRRSPPHIYPNPASDVLYIDAAENASWTITNLQGLNLATGVGNVVNVSGLSAGIYMVFLDNHIQKAILIKE